MTKLSKEDLAALKIAAKADADKRPKHESATKGKLSTYYVR